MALAPVLNVLRLYLETCPLPECEMQEGARAPAPSPVTPLLLFYSLFDDIPRDWLKNVGNFHIPTTRTQLVLVSLTTILLFERKPRNMIRKEKK